MKITSLKLTELKIDLYYDFEIVPAIVSAMSVIKTHFGSYKPNFKRVSAAFDKNDILAREAAFPRREKLILHGLAS